ncbi:MAG: hypothetical protein HC915_08690 [Anaerolineae bacterium]|nr:hypothetical protein [Anaerolineae bacterium]
MLGLSNVVIFHLARVATSFFMFSAIYQLGAAVWTRLRPRRLFFSLTAVGSGLGWFVLVLDNDAIAPDLFVPEAFPLLAAYSNPHFPLAIGILAVMAAQFITVFRPGYKEAPTADNGGLLILLLTVILTLVSPPGVLAMGGMLTVYTVVRAYRTRKLPWHEARWGAMVILPAAPFALYYLAVFAFNDVLSGFNDQNITQSPNPILFIFGYGLLLLIAVPGLVRAVRRFEPDGDQMMLCWVVAGVISIYLPFALQRRMFIGLIFPVVYFGVRALEDYWVNQVPKRWQAPLLLLLFVFILPTHAFTFGAPLALTVVNPEFGADNFLNLNSDYIRAFDWLNANAEPGEVALAARSPALWLPARTSLRVVYGHPFESVPAEERLNQMRAFYRGEDCSTLVTGEGLPFQAHYILWGPAEEKTGEVTSDDLRDDRLDLSDIGLGDFNLEALDDEQLEDILDERRLPEADNCRLALEEAGFPVERFGSVTLFRIRP